ncbi:MAG: protein kinase, partial [Planctomycetota bacterium]
MPETQTYSCPTCGTPLELSAEPGKLVKCPKCGKKFRVPATNDTLRTPQPPPASRPTAATDDTVKSPGRRVATAPHPADAEDQPQPDDRPAYPTIPGYEILDELGRGGMGVVYKARQTGLNRVVALKMILSAELAGPEMLVRFRIEAEAVAQLQHPNIIQIYEIAEHNGRPYFSMEFVEGGSLAKRIGGKPQPPKWCAEMAEKLALAMHAAHAQGIVHRDLKPANVMLSPS